MSLQNLKKMASHFENTGKDIIMSEKDEKDCRSNINCQIFEKEIFVDKVRDHCHLTGKFRGPLRGHK